MAKYNVTVRRTTVQTAIVRDVEADNRADAIEMAKLRACECWEDYSSDEETGDIQLAYCRETQSNKGHAKELREYARAHSEAFPKQAAELLAEADRLEKL